MSREPLTTGTSNTSEGDEALALIRQLAQAAARTPTTHVVPTWHMQQAISAVAQVVSGLGDPQRVTDDELQRYIAVYFDAYYAEMRRLQST